MKKTVIVSKAKVEDLDKQLLVKGVDGSKLSYAEKVRIGEILFPNGIEVETVVPNWQYISRDYLGFTGILKRNFICPYYKIEHTKFSNGYEYTWYVLSCETNGKQFSYRTQKPNELQALVYFYIWEELMILPKLEENFVENNAWDNASETMKEKYKDYIGKTPREMLDLKRKNNSYYIKTIDELVSREIAFGGKHIDFVKSKIINKSTTHRKEKNENKEI